MQGWKVMAMAGCALVGPLRGQDRTAQDWQRELGRAQFAMGSYIATYSGESPGRPPLRLIMIEDREGRSALVRGELGDERFAVWQTPLGQKGGGFHIFKDDAAMRVVGFEEMTAAYFVVTEALDAGLHREKPKAGKNDTKTLPRVYGYLTEEDLNFGIGMSAILRAMWFESQMVEQVEEIRVQEDRVEFELVDGQRFVADRANGMLLKQELPSEEGVKRFVLEGVNALQNGKVLQQEIPKEALAVVRKVHVSQMPVVHGFTRDLLEILTREHLRSKMTAEERGTARALLVDPMMGYWKAIYGQPRLAGLFGAGERKWLKDEVLRKGHTAYVRDHPITGKDLTFRNFVLQERNALRAEAADRSMTAWQKSPAGQDLDARLDDYIARYRDKRKTVAEEVRGLFHRTSIEAVLDCVIEEMLENL